MRRWMLWLAIFIIAYLALLTVPLRLSHPPFRLTRKVVAKLPDVRELLVTDLDSDKHPEILAVSIDGTFFWIRSPFDNPSVIKLAGCKGIDRYHGLANEILIRSLPVLVHGKLRLLRWRDGKTNFVPLPSVPDKLDKYGVYVGEGTRTIFLVAHLGANAWVFTLTKEGKWKFVGKFVSEDFKETPVHSGGYIYDLADLDKDGKMDAICIRWHPREWAWVVWGDERKGEKDLGGWVYYGYPLVADLNGDGWVEIAMITSSPRNHIQIWRFSPKQKRLKVVVKLPTPELTWGNFDWQLFDLDCDGLYEVVVRDFGYEKWRVFKLKGEKLVMWQSRGKIEGIEHDFVSDGEHNYFVTYGWRIVLIFPPLIWFEGIKLRWEWREEMRHSIFWELPKGKAALSPSNWRKHEAPFELLHVIDIDSDGCDELIGKDERGHIRLYWFRRKKSGELGWRSTMLGGAWIRGLALLKNGERSGLCVCWEDGVIEMLEVQKARK